MRLSYTITQTYGRTRRLAISASENNGKQLIQTSTTRDKLVRPVRHNCEQLFDYTVQFSWGYICMKDLSDFLAEIIYTLPFLLFFFLVSLIILRDCISVGFLIHLILTLNFKRRGRISSGETLDC